MIENHPDAQLAQAPNTDGGTVEQGGAAARVPELPPEIDAIRIADPVEET